jgi:nicotinamidase-related amidase
MLDPKQTVIVLIGYQNDYFAADGILNSALEDKVQVAKALVNTIELLDELFLTPVTFIAAPIIFTPSYEELIDPVGILKVIRDVGAFKAGTKGAETIDELKRFGDRILSVPGKRGLNAFSNTELHQVLQERGIRNVVFAGIVTSLCIDSSARQAADTGYNTYILTDCTAGRTSMEQGFYCKEVFPLYANVITKDALLQVLKRDGAKGA